jgi:hypothetical protein
MECLIGGAFLALIFLGFLVWLAGAIQGKQVETQLAAPRTHHPRAESPSGGRARVVDYTPRQKATAQRTKASDRAITSARRQSLKGLPKGTAQVAPLGRAVDYEGHKVTAMYLSEDGTVLGYGDLADHPLDWE